MAPSMARWTRPVMQPLSVTPGRPKAKQPFGGSAVHEVTSVEAISIELGAGVFDHLRPLLYLGTDEAAELGASQPGELGALSRPDGFGFVGAAGLADFLDSAGLRIGGHTLGPPDAVPGRHVVVGQTHLRGAP